MKHRRALDPCMTLQRYHIDSLLMRENKSCQVYTIGPDVVGIACQHHNLAPDLSGVHIHDWRIRETKRHEPNLLHIHYSFHVSERSYYQSTAAILAATLTRSSRRVEIFQITLCIKMYPQVMENAAWEIEEPYQPDPL
ncbi:hypothetical protein GJ744_002389 [Endocarpon pusillum]|uniref:Uncharacterized protein n=1 Tax=Endocarpon pusillum TaxID=364733 RepID=A0A8H7ASM3_9EURO|nr:hypothetical protein GJ744_002389 [Endocarpon pusillum]